MSETDSDDSFETFTEEKRKVFRELVPMGPRPLLQPSSRSTMFGPLAVLIAILPGLYGLSHWDLTPPGPWWGLRGLAVLDDHLWLDQSQMADDILGRMEYSTLRRIALQPPFYAWLEALFIGISPTRSPLAAVLPSYFSGVVLILMVYLQGRTWSKPGTAILAAWIFAFHDHTLDTMQRAGPASLGAASLLGAIQFYSLHILAGQDGRIRGRILYAMGCGACLGVSLMSVGLVGLMLVPVIGFHQVALNAGESPLERTRYWYEAWRVIPGLFYGSTAMAVAMVIAAPWHVWMTMVHASDFWLSLIEPTRPMGLVHHGPWGFLVEASPVLLSLALFAGWTAVSYSLSPTSRKQQADLQMKQAQWLRERQSDFGTKDQNGLILWTIWAVIALILSIYWPLGPQNTLGLLLAAPLSLLAGHSIRGLAQREISARILIWITPLTVFSLLWHQSTWFRDSLGILQQSKLSEIFRNPATAVFAALFCLRLWGQLIIYLCRNRLVWSRVVLGFYFFTILTVQTGIGVKVLSFRHTITRQLLDLREAIIRRNNRIPIEKIYVIGSISPVDLARMRPDLVEPDPLVTLRVGVLNRPNSGIDPAGRLRFILHSALPRAPQSDFESVESLFDVPVSQRLVIVVGNESRVSIADQSRLGLEPIHPGVANILTAFATSNLGKASPGSKSTILPGRTSANWPVKVPSVERYQTAKPLVRPYDPAVQLISLDDFTR